jgi:hypothetical protein
MSRDFPAEPEYGQVPIKGLKIKVLLKSLSVRRFSISSAI